MDVESLILMCASLLGVLFLSIYYSKKPYLERSFSDRLIFWAVVVETLFLGLVLSWSSAESLFFSLLYVFISYYLLCLAYKKTLFRKLHIIAFTVTSLLFVIYISACFGAYYYNLSPDILLDEKNEAIRILVVKMIESGIPDGFFLTYSVFVLLGLEGFFVRPESFSFNDMHCIQRVIGIVLGGTLLSWLWDMIKSKIMPASKS